MSDAITFVAQLYDLKTRRDGGGRIQLDFGADAMPAIVQLLGLNASGDTNLGIAIVPYRNEQAAKDSGERVDPETGEILFDHGHLD